MIILSWCQQIPFLGMQEEYSCKDARDIETQSFFTATTLPPHHTHNPWLRLNRNNHNANIPILEFGVLFQPFDDSVYIHSVIRACLQSKQTFLGCLVQLSCLLASSNGFSLSFLLFKGISDLHTQPSLHFHSIYCLLYDSVPKSNSLFYFPQQRKAHCCRT